MIIRYVMKLKNKVLHVKQTDDSLEYLQKLKGLILDLKLIYEKTSGLRIQGDIRDICKTTQKILQCLIDNNSKISRLKLFIEYYLPELIEILNQYTSIKSNNISSDKAINTATQIEDFIPKAKDAFNKILEDISIKNNANTEIDMKIMLSELKEKRLL